jgi:membrane glycosyltransferase
MVLVLTVQLGTNQAPQSNLDVIPNNLLFDRSKAGILALLFGFLILLPRIVGYTLIACDKRKRGAFGGIGTLCVSALHEMLMAFLFFNLRMMVRVFAYASIVMGRDSGWRAAQRDDVPRSTADFLHFHASYAIVGAALAVISLAISTTLFLWLLPVTLTLVCSGPLSAACAGRSGGQWLHCFTTPEERLTPSIVESARSHRNSLTKDFSGSAPE